MAGQTCYFPDGTASAAMSPCDVSATNSACCANQGVCMSNGFCFQQDQGPGSFDNRLARWGCTDPTFTDEACPQFCKDVFNNTAVSVILALDEPTGVFCCGDTSNGYNQSTQVCNQPTLGSNQPFPLPAGEVIYDRAVGATLENGTIDVALAGAAPSSGASPSSGGAPTSGAAPSTGATFSIDASSSPGGVFASTGSSSSPTGGFPSPVATTGTGDTTSNSAVMTIAASIAAPLGVLFLAALSAAIVFWRQTRTLKRQLKQQSQAAGYAHPPIDPHGSVSHPTPGSQPYHHEMSDDQKFQPRTNELEAWRVYEAPGHSFPN